MIPRPVKALLGILPFCYGALVLIALPDSRTMFVYGAVALVFLLVLAISFGPSLAAIWPVFPGGFLMVACTLALLQGATDVGPITHVSSELMLAYLPALLYMGWGVYAVWKGADAM